jgi:hypothetical protein
MRGDIGELQAGSESTIDDLAIYDFRPKECPPF